MKNLIENFNLKKINSFGVDAEARYFFEFSEVSELKNFLKEIENSELKNYKKLILGGGTNILFKDKIYEGIILHPNLNEIKVIREDDYQVLVKVAAGTKWDNFVEYTIKQNWSGIENLSAIPGSVGAAPVQNIGAYGVEIRKYITEVETISLLHEEGFKTKVFANTECKFGYRDSIFKNELRNKYMITSVTFKFNKDYKPHTIYGNIQSELDKMQITKPTLSQMRKAIINIRSKKLPQPEIIGNAGSFFKNPIVDKDIADVIKDQYPNLVVYQVAENTLKIPAGWLVEHTGWKGKRFGDAGVHFNQALVLVNYGNATGKDIYNLAKQVQYAVLDKFGIDLDMEVNVV